MDDSASSGRTNIFKKIIGFLNPSSHEDDVTEEEIISMVNEGHEQEFSCFGGRDDSQYF